MKTGLGVLVVVVGCTRPVPDAASPDPASRPLPDVVESPPPPPKTYGARTCEPTVRCGAWSKCVWLEQVGPDRYREVNGKAVFVRRHECWPGDAGVGACAVYCTGVDGGAPCVDGLHPEEETCAGAHVPHPNATPCPMGNGVCGSFM